MPVCTKVIRVCKHLIAHTRLLWNFIKACAKSAFSRKKGALCCVRIKAEENFGLFEKNYEYSNVHYQNVCCKT